MRRLITHLALLRRRFRRDDNGAAVVEFAIIAMIFFWLFMGLLEIGLLMIFNNGLEDGVARASRLIRTGQVFRQNISAEEFRKQICKHVVLKRSCNTKLAVDVRAFRDFSSVKDLPMPSLNGNSIDVSQNYQTGAPRQVVVVRAFYNWEFFTPMIGALMSRNGGNSLLLQVATTFRNEPYGSK